MKYFFWKSYSSISSIRFIVTGEMVCYDDGAQLLADFPFYISSKIEFFLCTP